nr:PEPxxWA-CTERM sorting domain-containing protein [Phenylobacterium sp.]
MRKLILAGATAAAALLSANAASAATVVLFSDFENDGTISQGFGTWGVYGAADGWTTLAGPGIEIQNHAAGNPDPTGGTNFVELDSHANSSMFYTLGSTGSFDLSFLYSPRPNVGSTSNVIDVYLDTTLLGTYTANGGGGTSWSTANSSFYATAGQKLIFAAGGSSDSLGGYVDNITLSAVPEPATWAMMIMGFGLAGSALRRRREVLAYA